MKLILQTIIWILIIYEDAISTSFYLYLHSETKRKQKGKVAEIWACISNAVFLPVLERQIGKESERKMVGQKKVFLRRARGRNEKKDREKERGGIHSWETRIPMPLSLFRGDLSHTTVNATEQTDGKGFTV